MTLREKLTSKAQDLIYDEAKIVKTKADIQKAKSLALYLQYCGMQVLLDNYNGDAEEVMSFLNKAGSLQLRTWQLYPEYCFRLFAVAKNKKLDRNLFANSFSGVFKTTGFISDDIELTV